MNAFDEYAELLRRLISIPSISREEKEAADFLERWMNERGMEVGAKAITSGQGIAWTMGAPRYC